MTMFTFEAHGKEFAFPLATFRKPDPGRFYVGTLFPWCYNTKVPYGNK